MGLGWEEEGTEGQRPEAGYSLGCSILCTQLVSGLDDLDKIDILAPFAFPGDGEPQGQQFSSVSCTSSSIEDR